MSNKPTIPPVVYLRGAGAAERNFVLLEQASAARGWLATRDFNAAWHTARAGLTYVVMCDFTPADGNGRSKGTVLVQRVRAKYNPDAASSLADEREFVKARHSYGGELPRPEKFDDEVLNHLRQPGAYVLDTDAVVEMIARALEPPAGRVGVDQADAAEFDEATQLDPEEFPWVARTDVEHVRDFGWITLGLDNRDEVITFLDGPFVDAKEPDDPGSDVVIVDLIDRRAVVTLGDTVFRLEGEFVIGRRGSAKPRDRFPR